MYFFFNFAIWGVLKMMSFPNDLIHDGIVKWVMTMKALLGELPNPSGKHRTYIFKNDCSVSKCNVQGFDVKSVGK